MMLLSNYRIMGRLEIQRAGQMLGSKQPSAASAWGSPSGWHCLDLDGHAG